MAPTTTSPNLKGNFTDTRTNTGIGVIDAEQYLEARANASLQHLCYDLIAEYNKYKDAGYDALMVSLSNRENNPIWNELSGTPEEIQSALKSEYWYKSPIVLLDLHEPFPLKEILKKGTFAEIKGGNPYITDLVDNKTKRQAMIVSGPLISGILPKLNNI